jgi:LacI family transcriptional regulator
LAFDGTEISEFCSPRLTTVKVPLEEIGVRAVKVLLTQIREGVGAPEKIVLPVHLKAGDSTAALEPEYQEEKKGELCSV